MLQRTKVDSRKRMKGISIVVCISGTVSVMRGVQDGKHNLKILKIPSEGIVVVPNGVRFGDLIVLEVRSLTVGVRVVCMGEIPVITKSVLGLNDVVILIFGMLIALVRL